MICGLTRSPCSVGGQRRDSRSGTSQYGYPDEPGGGVSNMRCRAVPVRTPSRDGHAVQHMSNERKLSPAGHTGSALSFMRDAS